MNISFYQALIALVSIIFLIKNLIGFIKKDPYQTRVKFIATNIIWIPVLTLSLFPYLARFITQKLGMGENLNTLIFIGFVINFIIIFKLINQLQKLERKITELVRHEALKKIKTKK